MKILLCKIKGHELIGLNNESLMLEEFECKNCSQKFTTDGYGKVVKLTPYWVKNNLVFKNNKNYNY
ncbi:MAG: hypothetical protein ACI9SJ_000780 [Flavobacteriaceae bacterium]|jgi:hypothetical protein|uniref:hypothetical protein n=1 Tax=Candidatus Marifrigoribacter sp. Uisw_064 TaxID=3230970 RepID=UPI003AD9EB3E|tara:strand:- start:115 stop:312 length:198 start_codon:yes stop_codon:yes gene_type:complete